MLAVLSGVALIARVYLGAHVYTTAVGAQQSVQLADGSVMYLNTDSSAQVRFDEHRREVRLIRGEALFTVAHDKARPFFVVTENASVRAVGTQFNVHRSGEFDTTVAVIDGVVQVVREVSAASGGVKEERLAAGEEASISQSNIIKAQAPNVTRAVAWRARRLMFPGDRLVDIANEFNRYNHRHITVQGASIQSRKVSGIFDADDPTPLFKFIEQFPDIVVEQSDDEVIIRERH